MHEIDLILTLTGGLAAALVCGYLTLRLGLSPIVGYLLAGFLVGPKTPGFTANKGLADQFAEVGVILLMFGVGLQFHVKELLAVKRLVVPGAIARGILVAVLGGALGLLYGWGLAGGVVFGLGISVASTVVLTRVLADSGELHTPVGHFAIGWLVVEDLLTVLVLVLLPAIFSPGGENGTILAALGLATAKLAALLVLMMVVGKRGVPWILDRAASTRSRELFTLTVLVLALGIAVGTALIFGVSMALGAFLAGMVVGRSDFSLRAATEALPMRDAFAVLFFVSVGMLFDPHHLIEFPGLILATLFIVLVVKPLIALAAVYFLKYPLKLGVSLAVVTAQIGEFSFILAAAAKQLHLLDDTAVNTVVAVAIISITLNPILYRNVHKIEAVLRRYIHIPIPGDLKMTHTDDESKSSDETSPYRAVIVGYGPVGQTVVRLLLENDIQPIVLELNMTTVRQLREQGIPAIYGDATHAASLQKAGLPQAVALILSSSNMPGAQECLRQARELNPKIRIFARTDYLRDGKLLREAGADAVFSGEGEVALSMTEFILRRLGATADQVDRQRDQFRAEVLGEPDGMFSAISENIRHRLKPKADTAPAAESPESASD
jgi:CPA2 family monovalent cation:H+ antiporter-2